MNKFEVFVLYNHTDNNRRFIRLFLFSEMSRKLAEYHTHTHTHTHTQANLRVLDYLSKMGVMNLVFGILTGFEFVNNVFCNYVF